MTVLVDGKAEEKGSGENKDFQSKLYNDGVFSVRTSGTDMRFQFRTQKCREKVP